VAGDVDVFVQNGDVLGRLNDLKRIRHVRDPRHPGALHFVSGSAVRRFSKFSRFFASAHGWYGISFPSTTPCPAGTPSDAA